MNLPRTDSAVSARPWLWWTALAFALVLTLLESFQRSERVEAMSNLNSGFEYEKEVSSNTTSGYEGGVRYMIPSDRSDDLHWIVNTQIAAKDAGLRLRRVDYDNAPLGREVHWSSVYSFWIRAVALVDRSMRGGNLSQAIERASLYANLLLVAAGLALLAIASSKRLGVASSVGVSLCFVSLLAFRDVFKFGMGDHHAAAILCAVLCVSFFAIALRGSDQSAKGKSFIVFSALFGALGMWVNVVSQIPALLGLHLGGLVIALANDPLDRQRFARSWRLWSRLGFSFSVLAYVFEYAPHHFGMRLEVNHPLHALAWLGGGELVAATLGRKSWKYLFHWRPVFSLVAIFQLPLVVSLARESVFRVADPFLLALHDRYIAEFQTLWANLAILPSPLRSVAMLLPFTALGIAVVVVIVQWRRERMQAPLVLAVCVALTLTALTFYQARWWAEASALLIPVFALCLAGSSKWLRAALFASLFPGLLFTMASSFADEPVSRKERLRAVERGVAHMLRMRSGERDFVVLASPDATTNLVFYGGGKGLGTFYWENRDGLMRAAEIFASPTAELAKEKMDAAGVTHVVIYSWGGFEKEYLQLYADFVEDEPLAGSPFLMQLVRDQSIPNWLRPIAFQPPARVGEAGDVALIYEKVEEMSAGLAAARRFEYLLEMGLNSAALSMVDALSRHADSEPAAAISHARALALSGRREAFGSAVEELHRNAARWDSLAIEDRIRLSGVFAVAGIRDKAKSHLQRALLELDDSALRGLTADAIMHLFDLRRSLQVDLPDPDLADRARSLLPDRLKERFDAL